MSDTSIRPITIRGWLEYSHTTDDGKYYTGKMLRFDEPSKYGINGGRISKLSILGTGPTTGKRVAIYGYDRGLDFDNTPAGLLDDLLAVLGN